jgi:hypothetical protein
VTIDGVVVHVVKCGSCDCDVELRDAFVYGRKKS